MIIFSSRGAALQTSFFISEVLLSTTYILIYFPSTRSCSVYSHFYQLATCSAWKWKMVLFNKTKYLRKDLWSQDNSPDWDHRDGIIKEIGEINFNYAFNHIKLTSVIILLSINSKAAVRIVSQTQHFFSVMGKINAWEVSKHCKDPHSPAANEVDNVSFDIFSISGKHNANAFLLCYFYLSFSTKVCRTLG